MDADGRAVSPPRAVAVLAKRELLRFLRQPARIVAAVGTGLLLWLVVGGGLAGSVRLGLREAGEGALGASYATYLLPGAMTLVAMFAAVFASIGLIEDRREGFLQAVLASPAPRWSIALGTIAGGAVIAWLQALVLLPLAFFSGPTSAGGAALAALWLLVTAVALQSIGFCFAWNCRDTGSFHAVMNLVLMPLWLLSDAFFPVSGAAAPLAAVIRLNPLSWCGSSIRAALSGAEAVPTGDVLGMLGFAGAALATAVVVVTRARRIAMGA